MDQQSKADALRSMALTLADAYTGPYEPRIKSAEAIEAEIFELTNVPPERRDDEWHDRAVRLGLDIAHGLKVGAINLVMVQ